MLDITSTVYLYVNNMAIAQRPSDPRTAQNRMDEKLLQVQLFPPPTARRRYSTRLFAPSTAAWRRESSSYSSLSRRPGNAKAQAPFHLFPRPGDARAKLCFTAFHGLDMQEPTLVPFPFYGSETQDLRGVIGTPHACWRTAPQASE